MVVPRTMPPSHLPDLCLVNIFARVPLSDLLRSVRAVCSNWHRVVPTELNRRRELVLVPEYNNIFQTTLHELDYPFGSGLMEHVRRDDGSPWTPRVRSLGQMYYHDVIVVPGGYYGVLTEAFTTPLPGITHLTLVQSFQFDSLPLISMFKQITRLLNHYRDGMVSLKVEFTCTVERVNDQTDVIIALFESINRLDSLRHLTLNIGVFNVTRCRDIVLPRLSILSHLDTFTSKYSSSWLMDSIRQYATENVRIDCEPSWSLDEIVELDPKFTSKFTSAYLTMNLTAAHYDNLRQLGDRFWSLSRLSLDVWTMPITMLTRCLSPLSQLVHLNIHGHFVPLDEYPEPEYVQLPSVRLLTLKFVTKNHLMTERFHLAEIFPNLQVLSLYHGIYSCPLCGYHVHDSSPDSPEEIPTRIGQCIRLVREPFRRCLNLHTVKHGGGVSAYINPNKLITRDEL